MVPPVVVGVVVCAVGLCSEASSVFMAASWVLMLPLPLPLPQPPPLPLQLGTEPVSVVVVPVVVPAVVELDELDEL